MTKHKKEIVCSQVYLFYCDLSIVLETFIVCKIVLPFLIILQNLVEPFYHVEIPVNTASLDAGTFLLQGGHGG